MKSPHAVQQEAQLIKELDAQRRAHKPSIVFVGVPPSFTQEQIQQDLTMAHAVALEKRVPEDSRVRYIQRVPVLECVNSRSCTRASP